MTHPLRQAVRATAVLAGAALLAACAGPAAPPEPATPLTAASPQNQMHDLKAFPERIPGYVRHVITLPAQADEEALKIELIGGKTARVDCNVHGLDGRFEAHEVPGWGYRYWQLESRGQMRSTRMACPPGSERRVFVRAASTLARYNSKLPVVVFIPEGMELRWRVWSAGPTHDAEAGPHP